MGKHPGNRGRCLRYNASSARQRSIPCQSTTGPRVDCLAVPQLLSRLGRAPQCHPQRWCPSCVVLFSDRNHPRRTETVARSKSRRMRTTTWDWNAPKGFSHTMIARRELRSAMSALIPSMLLEQVITLFVNARSTTSSPHFALLARRTPSVVATGSINSGWGSFRNNPRRRFSQSWILPAGTAEPPGHPQAIWDEFIDNDFALPSGDGQSVDARQLRRWKTNPGGIHRAGGHRAPC